METLAIKGQTQENTKTSSNNKKWYSEDEVNNEIISAYRLGKESLKQEAKRSIEKALDNAKGIVENVYFTMRSAKIICKEIRLKRIGIKQYEAIFILSEKDYLSSEKYSIAYNIASSILEEQNDKDLCFSYLFIPKTKSINQAALISDGFAMTFKTVKKDTVNE